jgi:dihydropteroate synthase
MLIGNREFDIGNRCYIMGILNVTPDSFFDGGKWDVFDNALYHVEDMVKSGADIIDIGGESTKPGYTRITVQEEIDRVVPVIEALKIRFDIPLSADTYKSAVAKAALSVGAHLVNDIWGFKHDPDMAGVVACAGVPCCLMHNRNQIDYSDFMRDMLDDLCGSVEIARKAGIAEDKIILDPGVGFAKTYEMNLEVINRLDLVRGLGYPVLLGASRKSVIGMTLGLQEDERLEGSLVAVVIGMMRGCSFVRVHDVKETKRVVMMTEAVV